MARRTHRPLYGPREWVRDCPGCKSPNSKIRGGNYVAGTLYCRRRVCVDCGSTFTTREPVDLGGSPTGPKALD